jgi:hypothetical protein
MIMKVLPSYLAHTSPLISSRPSHHVVQQGGEVVGDLGHLCVVSTVVLQIDAQSLNTEQTTQTTVHISQIDK